MYFLCGEKLINMAKVLNVHSETILEFVVNIYYWVRMDMYKNIEPKISQLVNM